MEFRNSANTNEYACVEITPSSVEWPLRLNVDYPGCGRLYCKGNLSLFAATKIGIVGSRNISDYGDFVIRSFLPDLNAAGLIVVSGFMRGVDAAAHAAASKTVAILPSGIERFYPSNQKGLYFKILDSGGLVISQFPPRQPAFRWSFPMRNRIIASLSDSLFVVEAESNSGSLNTARTALQFGWKVFVAPNRINAVNSSGIFDLLKLGAELATSPIQILDWYEKNDFLTEKSKSEDATIKKIRKDFREIHSILKVSSESIESLSKKVSKDFSEIASLLTEMEMLDLIYKSKGRYYAR